MPQAKNVKARTDSSPIGHLFGESTKKTGLDANWNLVNPSTIIGIVWGVTELGGNVTLGCTKKGNAYTIKVYLGAPYDPMYFDGDEEGRAEMDAWADKLVQTVAERA